MVSPVVWEWNDPNDPVYSWKPYRRDLQQDLERAWGSGQSTAHFQVESVNYVVHVGRDPMVQINMKTKYKRQVRRRDGTFSQSHRFIYFQSVCVCVRVCV
jgi:hypothetical protein